jgi:superfamily II DNA or RNA helicase
VVLKSKPEGAPGVVAKVYDDAAEPQYEVFFGGFEGDQVFPERNLLPDGATEEGAPSGPVDYLRQWRLADADGFRSFLTLSKLTKPLADNLYSFVASRTERLPYQFKPVLKLLDSPYSRLLVADEVGLGKTIEAGIILTELQARARLEHVLVACPSSLMTKWREELLERFDLDFEVVGGPRLREVVADIAREGGEPHRVIGSLELMRRAENLEAVIDSRPHFDLLIVDEAHHLRNRGTRTNELGEALTMLAQAAIFLTATPLNLGREDFFELLRLLVPEEFHDFGTFTGLIEPNQHINTALRIMRSGEPDYGAALSALGEVMQTDQARRFQASARYQGLLTRLRQALGGEPMDREANVRCQRDLIELNTLSHVFTRTKKREVAEHFPTRRATPVSVDLQPVERTFYNAVTRWVEDHYGEQGFGGHGFVTTMFQRQAASCLPAMGRKLERTVLSHRFELSADEVDEIADLAGLETLEAVSFELTDEELDPLTELRRAWRDYGERVDTKFDEFAGALTSALEEGAEKALVFSFFVGTIDYLAEKLEGMTVGGRPLQVLKLYGPMGRDARHAALRKFRSMDGPVVMLSSEVGSEGLDFQFCSTMFNYDLPWNPMRVEQRIGRLDRYGQESELIHILNMVVTDTVEERIFYRLYERINIFEESIGDLEAILGEVEGLLTRLQRDALQRRLTAEEEDQRTRQIADVILRRQQEHEEFDRDSRRFLGNDDVFLERFNDIESSRRYVTPDDLRGFVERWLSVRFPRVRLEPAGESDVLRLTGADIGPFARFLSSQLAREPGKARIARQFVNRLYGEEPLRVTFEPARALQDRTVEFISLHHPLVRVIAGEVDAEDGLMPSGLLRLAALGLERPHCFFIYQLSVTGMKDQLEFDAVVVDGDGKVHEPASEGFLGAVADAQSIDDSPLFTDDEITRAESAARHYIAAGVARREQELTQLNDEVVDAQLESLRLGFERRQLWLHERIEAADNERIERMRRSQLVNWEADFEARVAELERKRGVTVGQRLIAAGVVVA